MKKNPNKLTKKETNKKQSQKIVSVDMLLFKMADGFLQAVLIKKKWTP